MLAAALRAASAAPFAASPACPPTAPTMAPKPAPALATPCCTQFPNASKKPCGSEGAGTPAGADDGASGPGPVVCAAAAMQANTKALNANRRAPARTATAAHSGSRHRAWSGFVSILIAVRQFSCGGLQLPLYLPRQAPQAGEGGSGNLRQIAFKLEQVDCGKNAREEDRDT